MGTLKVHGDLAALKARDSGNVQFSEANRLAMINDILETIYQTLINVNSNLVYAIGTVTTSADTPEYTPTFSHDGFLRDGSWVDGEDTYLSQVEEVDKIKWDYDSSTNQPEAFYITEDSKVGYLWVPDDAYTINHTYWKPLTALTTYATDALPWGGIWNRTIQRLLIVEMMEILEVDSSKQAVLADIEWDKAMIMVYARGVRKERVVSNMFSVEGI